MEEHKLIGLDLENDPETTVILVDVISSRHINYSISDNLKQCRHNIQVKVSHTTSTH